MITKQLISTITNIILFIIGLSISIFASIILLTGMDEIWNGFNVQWYLVCVLGLFYSIGISCMIIAINKENRAPKIFRFLTIFFFVSAVVSFMLS